MRLRGMLRAFASCVALSTLCGVLSALAAEDEAPLPFAFREVQTLDPKMKDTLAIAIDKQDGLYFAGAEGVKVFDAAGKLQRTIKTSGPACAIALDDEGGMFVAQRARVEKFDAEGKLEASWGEKGEQAGQFSHIVGLAAAGPFVYVADGGARRILRFAATGDFVDQLEQLIIPGAYFDCVTDGKGGLFVAHTGKHLVEHYDENYKLLGAWGEFGTAREKFSGCCNPTNLALFPDGRVVTTEKGIPRMKVYDAKGQLLAHLGKEAFSDFADGLDLAVDSKGRIAVLDPVLDRARIYELSAAPPAAAK